MRKMKYIIRKTSIEDIQEITNIISKTLLHDFPYKKETIKAYRKIFNKKYFTEFIKHKKNFILGAYKKNDLVGIIAIKPDFGGVLYIDWLAVKKENRGEGIGSILLQKTDEWALKHKFHYIYLFTETDRNINYYEKRGFKYVGKYGKSWFGETEHTLGKQLCDKPFPEVFKI